MNAKVRKRIHNRQYGTARHKRAKREARVLVDSGLARCARCGDWIEPGSPVDVGHDDQHPGYYSGPEHVECNRAAPHRNVTSIAWS